MSMRTMMLRAALFAVAGSSNVGAQTCRSASETPTQDLLAWVGDRTEPVDSSANADRIAMGYPQVARAQLSVVTQAATCNKVLTAYQAAMPGAAGLTGRISVIKAGTTYTVFDPGAYLGPAPKRGDMYVLLDSKCKVIKKFGI